MVYAAAFLGGLLVDFFIGVGACEAEPPQGIGARQGRNGRELRG